MDDDVFPNQEKLAAERTILTPESELAQSGQDHFNRGLDVL